MLNAEAQAVDSQIKIVEETLQSMKLGTKKGMKYDREKCTDINHTHFCFPFKKNHSSLSKIKKIINDLKFIELHQDVIKILENFPSEKDMNGAVSGSFALHTVYKLNWIDLISSKGLRTPSYFNTQFIKTKFKICPKDLEVLGKIACQRKFYDQAFELLTAAKSISTKHGDTQHVAILNNLLNFVVNMHDANLDQNMQPLKKGFYPYYLGRKRSEEQSTLKRTKDTYSQKTELFSPFIPDRQMMSQYNGACRGDRLRSHSNDMNSRSFYLHRQKAYLRLGPFPVEEKSLAPYVVVFHKFFHIKECDAFIQHASPGLERSKVFVTEGNLGNSMSRTTKSVYAPEDTQGLPEAGRVSDRVNLATDLKARFWPIEDSEEWQVG